MIKGRKYFITIDKEELNMISINSAMIHDLKMEVKSLK